MQAPSPTPAAHGMQPVQARQAAQSRHLELAAAVGLGQPLALAALQGLLIHCEFDGVGSCSRAQVVQACRGTESMLLPSVRTVSIRSNAPTAGQAPLKPAEAEAKVKGSKRTSLQALAPGVEMQRGELAKVGVAHVHVERLALVNVRAAVCGNVKEGGCHGWMLRLSACSARMRAG